MKLSDEIISWKHTFLHLLKTTSYGTYDKGKWFPFSSSSSGSASIIQTGVTGTCACSEPHLLVNLWRPQAWAHNGSFWQQYFLACHCVLPLVFENLGGSEGQVLVADVTVVEASQGGGWRLYSLLTFTLCWEERDWLENHAWTSKTAHLSSTLEFIHLTHSIKLLFIHFMLCISVLMSRWKHTYTYTLTLSLLCSYLLWGLAGGLVLHAFQGREGHVEGAERAGPKRAQTLTVQVGGVLPTAQKRQRYTCPVFMLATNRKKRRKPLHWGSCRWSSCWLEVLPWWGRAWVPPHGRLSGEPGRLKDLGLAGAPRTDSGPGDPWGGARCSWPAGRQ